MAQPTVIDVAALPELRRMAEEVRDTREPIVLQVDSEELAILIPLPMSRGRAKRVLSQAEIDAVMSAAGSWKGLIDVERFKAEIKAARSSTRPPVEL